MFSYLFTFAKIVVIALCVLFLILAAMVVCRFLFEIACKIFDKLERWQFKSENVRRKIKIQNGDE